ncbi:MAG: hypothetical protein LUC85_05345 [Bacteroidales bacterium]|nr:hypothetical protein [Bacteroidales bacterium]MCD8394245.1 hypothetical protein [Bacteroidales bacterium]
MERVTFLLRTTKDPDQEVKLRFRLRDGREVQLYHKSEIKAKPKDMERFNEDGSVKGRSKIVNIALKNALEAEILAMYTAYQNLCEKMDRMAITSSIFEAEIDRVLHPVIQEEKPKEMAILDRFAKFIEDAHRDGIFGDIRKKHYKVTLESFERFLKIRRYTSLTPSEFTPDMLMELREFFTNEYKYVKKFPKLYKDMSERNIPKEPRDANTVVTRMKKLHAFFVELESREEIIVNPFRRLGKQRKVQVMREQYDDPRFLHVNEFQKIMATEVPKELQETKDVFLLQCSFGARVGDFKALNMSKIAVTSEGIPYIHYLPQKTKHTNLTKAEIETPIMKFALDIIKKYYFKFPILKYVSGKSGYNAKIKKLLEICGIDRKVKVYDDEKGDNVFLPIFEFGSSKLARSTHVDMMGKVQINLYASGLHRAGSRAVERYTMMELPDRFALMCAAFSQPEYRVDKDLNIIE